mmetsp:Transcript_25810/g.51991  ORF Transcript_25810/g.51991 Transcript_25810/m.51991 type:complete len:247 (+) Transcript_25810:628-1368(+)
MAVAGVLFVDNTNLMHLNMSPQTVYDQVHWKIQAAIHNWGRLLIATGGALKPEKCSYTIIAYTGLPSGGWQYKDYSTEDNYTMTVPVPVPGEALRPITHAPVMRPQKTLGIYTAPNGDSTAQLEYMQKRAQTWIDQIRLGTVNRCLTWLGLATKFWPKVGYGIGSRTASFHQLSTCLQRQYYRLLLLCGVNVNIRSEFRQLPSGIFGIGLPHPGIEATVASVNLLLQHYECSSLLGIELQTSYEAW